MALESGALKETRTDAPPAINGADGVDGDDEETSAGKRSDPKYKIQITLNERQRRSLFHLKDETGVESAAQVVRDSLRVYEYLVEQLLSGTRELSIRDSSTGKETFVKLI